MDISTSPLQLFFVIGPVVNTQTSQDAALANSFSTFLFENDKPGFFLGHHATGRSRRLLEL
jgi:hypothetical protein